MEILFGIFLRSFLADPDYIWQVASQPNDGRRAKNECGQAPSQRHQSYLDFLPTICVSLRVRLSLTHAYDMTGLWSNDKIVSFQMLTILHFFESGKRT